MHCVYCSNDMKKICFSSCSSIKCKDLVRIIELQIMTQIEKELKIIKRIKIKPFAELMIRMNF